MQQRRKRTSCAGGKLIAACAVALYLWVIIKLHPHTPRHYDGPQLGETGDGFDATGETDDDADAIHLVFSTDCGGYQHWQAIRVGTRAWRRATAGPSRGSRAAVRKSRRRKSGRSSRKIDKTGRLRLHAAPSTAIGGYKYSNKPGGLVHFLQHAPVDARFVALVDPDMLMIKPLTLDVGRGTRRPRGTKLTEYVVDGVAAALSVFGDLPGHVAHGAPARASISASAARGSGRAPARGRPGRASAKPPCGRAVRLCGNQPVS